MDIIQKQEYTYDVVKGNTIGVCDRQFVIEIFISNVGCGRLQCQSDLERPLFGDSSSVQYIKNYVLKKNGQQVAQYIV